MNRTRLKWAGILGAVFLGGLAAIVVFDSVPPSDFSAGQTITIPDGSTVSQVAAELQADGIIRSTLLYKAYVRLINVGAGVKSGEYLFASPQSALGVAYRTAYGIAGLPTIKVTVPEGSSSKDISRILGMDIPGFATTTFALLAKVDEGYLFPDTYFFYENTMPQEVVSRMNTEFNSQAATIATATAAFGKPLRDVITMASIVEKEATSTADRRIIAGILWKRLSASFPLQVDPTFYYILNKGTSALTPSDLATISPYNTYIHTGLPPTPIDSPGMDAILDTITPISTAYWYYLSDIKGNIHYAVTYATQMANIAKYLK